MKELRLSLSKFDNNICENDIMLVQNLYYFQYLKTNETFNQLAINVPISNQCSHYTETNQLF